MVVVDERLNRRLLIDDHEPIRAANHILEFFALVARDKGEAIVLGPNLPVLGNSHLDLPRAGNVFVASRAALAKKLETFRLVSWPRFLGYPFDPLVYLSDGPSFRACRSCSRGGVPVWSRSPQGPLEAAAAVAGSESARPQPCRREHVRRLQTTPGPHRGSCCFCLKCLLASRHSTRRLLR